MKIDTPAKTAKQTGEGDEQQHLVLVRSAAPDGVSFTVSPVTLQMASSTAEASTCTARSAALSNGGPG